MKQNIFKIIKKHIKKNSTVVLAFSGGPDSVFLLHKLLEISKNWPLKIILAHFNHKLRGKESDADEKFSKKIAKKYNLIFETDSKDIKNFAKNKSLNLEDAARKKRYEFLEKIREKYKADCILTAHHLNDNLETFFINFLRGTGLKGLKAIQIKNKNIIRPLLYITKNEILDFLKKGKIKFRIDKSNYDKSFVRNNLRLNIIPALEKIQPKLTTIYQRNWEQISELFDFIEQSAKNWLKSNADENFKISINKFLKLHQAFQKIILQKIYEKLYGSTKGIKNSLFEKTLKIIQKKITGKKIHFGKNFFIIIGHGYFQVIPKKTLKNITIKKIKIPGETKFSYGKITTQLIKKSPNNISKAIYLDYNLIKTPISIRSKLNGDKFSPLGLKGRKKLQDLFVDKKIPIYLRNMIPIFIDSTNNIIAVGKHTINNRYKLSKKTKNILKISVNYLEKQLKNSKL
jgi:tRNA(Ile)-lysidine synthase